MTNIKSTIPAYLGNQVTLATLDSWLKDAFQAINDLKNQVIELKNENKVKDKIIKDLETRLESIEPSQQQNVASSDLWARLSKSVFKQQCNLITKENT